MKKLLSTILLCLLISFASLITLTFVMKGEAGEQKRIRSICDSMSLNTSGQGLSMPFLKKNDEFQALCIISKVNDNSCTMHVIVYKDGKKLTVKYPCQIKNQVIYSVGVEYAHVSVFCLTEYVIIGSIIFCISFAVLAAIRIIKG